MRMSQEIHLRNGHPISTKRSSRTGLVKVTGILFLVLLMGGNAAFASNPFPLSLSVTGTVLNVGNQIYSVSGGSVIYASINGQTVDPSTATLTFAISATVIGLGTSGTSSFHLDGTTGG